MHTDIWELLRRTPKDRQAWLVSALQELTAPKTLVERQWHQINLVERYQVVFKTDALTAVKEVAEAYGDRFPH